MINKFRSVPNREILRLRFGSLACGLRRFHGGSCFHKFAVGVLHLLDELIQQSVELVGKPVPLMNKDDKVRAIQFLNQSGAFLVTKSGDKVAKYFGISKYTLYSYIDKQQEEKNNG